MILNYQRQLITDQGSPETQTAALNSSVDQISSYHRIYKLPLIEMKPVPEPPVKRHRGQRSSISKHISSLISTNRATISMGSFFIILLHLSSVGEICGSENNLVGGQNHHHNHHTHARRHQSSPIANHFTNNNRHWQQIKMNEVEYRPLSSNENNDRFYNLTYQQYRPQVPEQLSIVVSSSDNSYVSASPVEISTTTSTLGRTLQKYRDHHRYLSTSSSTPLMKLHHQQHRPLVRPYRPQPQPIAHKSGNKKFNSQTTMVERRQIGSSARRLDDRNDFDDDDDDDDDDDYEIGEVFKHDLIDRTLQTSGNDISTTATTTQRSKIRHTVQKSPIHDESRSSGSRLTSGQQLDDENQIMPFGNKTKRKERSKLGLSAQYDIKTGSIIKTRESLDLGATFINYTVVTNLKACLVECWITDSCDTAIYQESPVDFNNHLPEFGYSLRDQRNYSSFVQSLSSSSVSQSNSIKDVSNDDEDLAGNYDDDDSRNKIEVDDTNGNLESSLKDSTRFGSFERNQPSEIGIFICYLFECVKSDGFKCQFSPHNYYISALKRGTLKDTVTTSGMHPEFSHRINSNPRKENVDEEDGDDEVVVLQTKETTSAPTNLDLISQDQSKQSDNNKEISGDTDPSLNAPYEASSILSRGSSSFELNSPNQVDRNTYSIVEQDDRTSDPDSSFRSVTPDSFSSQLDHQSSRLVAAHGRHETVSREELSQPVIQDKPETRSRISPPGPTQLNPVAYEKPHYSHIIDGNIHHRFNSRKPWHDSHIASIRIGQEEFEDFSTSGLNSAVIAIMIGVAATGVLIMIVGHKMKSIRSRLAHKSRRRSLVPDTDFLINTIPI